MESCQTGHYQEELKCCYPPQKRKIVVISLKKKMLLYWKLNTRLILSVSEKSLGVKEELRSLSVRTREYVVGSPVL